MSSMSRRLGELPTVDRSPSRGYVGGGGSSGYASGRASPLLMGSRGNIKYRTSRSGNSSPDQQHFGAYGTAYGPGAGVGGAFGGSVNVGNNSFGAVGGSPYTTSFYGASGVGATTRDESPVLMLEERGRSMSQGAGQFHHRSRSASRPNMSSTSAGVRYASSLDRASVGLLDHDREFVPIREPLGRRYIEDDLLYGPPQRQNPHLIGELQLTNNDLQRELGNLKKELELTNSKLGSSMHSIKTFWSPELKKERALRKEESTKYSLINEQLKLLNSENQVSVKKKKLLLSVYIINETSILHTHSLPRVVIY